MNEINVYIDGNNLHRSAKELNFTINYKKFRGWLRQRYKPSAVYLFIGLIPNRINFYKYLEMCGYILIFKKTIVSNGKIKGNCDTELVLKNLNDFYAKSFASCILITGDGDFGCLVEFLKTNNAINCIIAPNRNKCSILLRNKNITILFLNEHYHKFSEIKKAPNADVST